MSKRCPNKNSPEWKQMVKLFGEKNAWKIFIKEDRSVPDLNRIERYAQGYIQKKNNELPEGTFNYTEANKTQTALNKDIAPSFTTIINKISKNGKPFWNYEVIKKTNKRRNLLFSMKEDEQNFHINTLNKLLDFTDSLGIGVELTPAIYDVNKNIVENARAAANFVNGTIEILDDDMRASNWNALPEETAHWWYRLLNNNSSLKKELIKSYKTRDKAMSLYQYEDIYDKESLTEEAIGQLIAEEIANIENSTFIDKFIQWVKDVIKKLVDGQSNPHRVAALRILNADKSDLLSLEDYQNLQSDINSINIVNEETVATIPKKYQKHRKFVKESTILKDLKLIDIDMLVNDQSDPLSIAKSEVKSVERQFEIKTQKFKKLKPTQQTYKPTQVVLASSDKLIDKFKNNKISTKNKLKVDGISKKELDIYNEALRSLSETNKSVTVNQLVEEAIDLVNTARVYAFGEILEQFNTYNSNQFKYPINHKRIGILLNNAVYLSNYHGTVPSAWGSLTNLGNGSFMIHEIQSDMYEDLKLEPINYNRIESAIINMLDQRNLNNNSKLDNSKVNEIIKDTYSTNVLQRIVLDIVQPISIFSRIKEQRSLAEAINESSEESIERLNVNIEEAYRFRRIIRDINAKQLYKEYIKDPSKRIGLYNLDLKDKGYSKETVDFFNEFINKLRSGTVDFMGLSIKYKALNAIKNERSREKYVANVNEKAINEFINSLIQNKQRKLLNNKNAEYWKNIDDLSEHDKIKLIDNIQEDFKVYKNKFLEVVEKLRPESVKDKLSIEEQKKEIKKLIEDSKSKTLEKEKKFKKFSEGQLEYFTPLVHHLIQTHIKENGKETPLYFAGEELTYEAQQSKSSSAIYTGPEEVNKNGGKIGPLFKLMKKIKGIELEYVKDVGATKKSAGGYKINLSNYHYDQPILYSLKPKKQEKNKVSSKGANKALESKLFDFLNANGINVKNIKELQGRIGVDALGMADLAKRAVYLSDHRKEDTLPEEVAHFVIESLLDNRVVQNALNLVPQTEAYKKNHSEYFKIYGDENMVRKEILGKLLAQSIMDTHEETNKSIWNRLKTMFKAILNTFKGRVNPDKIDQMIKESLGQVALDVLDNNIEIQELGENNYYQLNEQAEQIKGIESEIREALQTRLKKLVVLQKNRKKEFSKSKIKEVENIEAKIANNKTAEGMLDFINVIYGDAKSTIERIKTIERSQLSLPEQARLISLTYQLNSGYKPLIDKIQEELMFNNNLDKADEIRGLIRSLSELLNGIESRYKKHSKRIFGEAIEKYLTMNPDIKKENIDQLLSVAENDISFARTWLDSMAESGDDILGATDRLVKDSLERTRNQAQMIQYRLIDLDTKLKQAGIKDTSFVLEKLKNGKYSGNFLGEYNKGEYEKSRKEWGDKVRESLNMTRKEEKMIFNGDNEALDDYIQKKMPKEVKEIFTKALNDNKGIYDEYLYPIFLENLSDHRKNLWKPWYKKNTKPNPEAENLIKAKKKQLYDELVTVSKDSPLYGNQVARAAEMFEEWYNENVTEYNNNGKSYKFYKKELALPADHFKSNVKLNAAQQAYYDGIMEIKNELESYIPEEFRNNLVPQIRKDWLERFKKNPKQALIESMKDLKRREDDTQYGLADASGVPIDFVPIFFKNKLSDMEDLSTDITSTMARFAEMAINYKNMNGLVDILEMGKDVLGERKIKTGKKDILSRIYSLFKDQDVFSEKRGGNSYERYKRYLDMVIYGKTSKDEGSFNVFGMEIDTAKAIDSFTRYTAINNLALNLYAGIANPLIGNWTIRQEAFAKEYFTHKDLHYATKVYGKEILGVLSDTGKLASRNKLRLFMEKVDAMDDFNARMSGMNADRKRWQKAFATSSFFVFNNIGEHEMRGRMTLALANQVKVKNKEGKEVNLYDAFEVKGPNQLELKEGYEFSEDSLNDFKIKLKGINKRLHGIYNEIDRSAIQQYSLGRAALLFRKFIKPGFNRRWNKKDFNYELGHHTEGYYRTGGRFWINLIKDMRKYGFSLTKNFEKLTPEEKANVIRFNYEVVSLLALTLLAAAVESGLDDDDDYLVTMLAYQMNRLQTEMMFFWNPTELPKLLKSPAAGVDMLNTTIGLITKSFDLNSIFSDDPFIREYKSGPNAGDTYFWHSLKKTVPIVDTVEDWFDPDEKLKYFNR